MLPFYSRLIWLIPFPAEWHWLPTWYPGAHPPSYVNSDIWKKYSNANAQSSSSNVPVVGSMSSSSTSAQSMSSERPTPSCAPTMATVTEERSEPEVTSVTSAIPQNDEVPVPRAFPYVTQTIPSDNEEVREIACTPFGSTLVQHVCRNMNDVEANEAVVNKTWFRTLADAEAPRFSSKMREQGVSTRVHMTRPQWVQQRLQQGEAALWSGKQENGPDSTSSSHALPPDEVQLPLHAMLQPSMEQLEHFLADEKKEMELLAAQHLLAMSQNEPSKGVRRLLKKKNAFVKNSNMSNLFRTERQRKKTRTKTIGSSTGSSCTRSSSESSRHVAFLKCLARRAGTQQLP